MKLFNQFNGLRSIIICACGLILSGCATHKADPLLFSVLGSSLAAPGSDNLRLFCMAKNGSLDQQRYFKSVADALISLGYKEVDFAQANIFVTVTHDFTAKSSQEVTYKNTSIYIPGSTTNVDTTTRTPWGTMYGTSTASTAPTVSYRRKPVLRNKSTRLGYMQIVAYDLKQSTLNNEIEAWSCTVGYAFDAPLPASEYILFEYILAWAKPRIAKNVGDWISSPTFDEVFNSKLPSPVAEESTR